MHGCCLLNISCPSVKKKRESVFGHPRFITFSRAKIFASSNDVWIDYEINTILIVEILEK